MVSRNKRIDEFAKQLAARLAPRQWRLHKSGSFERARPDGHEHIPINYGVYGTNLRTGLDACVRIERIEVAYWKCLEVTSPEMAARGAGEFQRGVASVRHALLRIEGEEADLAQHVDAADMLIRDRLEPWLQTLPDIHGVFAELQRIARGEVRAFQHPVAAATRAVCASWVLRDRAAFDDLRDRMRSQSEAVVSLPEFRAISAHIDANWEAPPA